MESSIVKITLSVSPEADETLGRLARELRRTRSSLVTGYLEGLTPDEVRRVERANSKRMLEAAR